MCRGNSVEFIFKLLWFIRLLCIAQNHAQPTSVFTHISQASPNWAVRWPHNYSPYIQKYVNDLEQYDCTQSEELTRIGNFAEKLNQLVDDETEKGDKKNYNLNERGTESLCLSRRNARPIWSEQRTLNGQLYTYTQATTHIFSSRSVRIEWATVVFM